MRCVSSAVLRGYQYPQINLPLLMFWMAVSAAGGRKASPGRGSAPPLNSLRYHLASYCKCKQSGQHDKHRASRLTGGLPWAPERTDQPSSAFVKSTILPAGSACNRWSWPARQRQRQYERWDLAAASVRGGSLRVEGDTAKQVHDRRNETASTVASGSVRLVHRSDTNRATKRGHTAKAISKVDARSYNTSAVATRSGSGGCGLDEICNLEPLVQQIATTLDQCCGVRGGDQILILVSGGSDSVALLVALHRAAPFFQPPLQLEVAHFNHALRGKDSDADELFVSDLTKSLGIISHVRRWQRAEDGGTGGAGPGMQERARKWRQAQARDILQGMLRKATSGGVDGREVGGGGRGFIATAHHRDDQAETVLLKALRGAHITNMQGMEWVAAPFIRPLLGASKSDMVEFLQKREQAWREDGSNQVAKCTRNRIRLQLMPLLRDLAGGARALDTRLDELSRQSRLAREMVQLEAEHWENQHYTCTGSVSASALDAGGKKGQSDFQKRESSGGAAAPAPARRRVDLFPLLPFSRVHGNDPGDREGSERPLPEFVREELLHRFVTANTRGAALPYAQLQLLMRQVDSGDNKWSLSLGGGLVLRRLGDFLRIQPEDGLAGSNAHPDNGESRSLKLHVSGVAADGGPLQGGEQGIANQSEEEQGMVLYNLPPGTKLDVRRRRDGDRFRPVWRSRPSKLKDFFRGQGVPLHLRDEVAVICDQDDDIVAVYPFFAGAGFEEDTTGTAPVLVRVEGAPLHCPCPMRGGDST